MTDIDKACAVFGQQSNTLSGPDAMSTTERMKTAMLYAELDRILGQTNVFLGGDQLISQLPNEDLRARATEAKENLVKLVAGEYVAGQNITPAQEARLDSLYKEISRIQQQAIDRNADQRNSALHTLIGTSPVV